MKSRKFLIGFIFVIIFVLLTIILFNAAVNPFGIMNTELLNWHSYNFTQNPRTAKISYLDKNYESYNAYIIGSSGSSAFPVEKLNQYNKKRNYNLFYYGADMKDSVNTARYIAENYNVDEILLPISFSAALSFDSENDDLNYLMDWKVEMSSPLSFYGKYLLADPRYGLEKIKSIAEDSYFAEKFDVFIPENGLYDKRLRDVEYLGSIEEYMVNNPSFSKVYTETVQMKYIDEAIESISKIKNICDQNNIKLTVVMVPLYDNYSRQYSKADIELFYSKLGEVTSYWDFTFSSVSMDPRYFYDPAHFRNAVGEMMLARIYGDSGVYIPDDFGVYVEQGTSRTYWQIAEVTANKAYTADVPVLLFHHFADKGEGSSTISEKRMISLLTHLKENGYTTVDFNDLKNYVLRGMDLPEKPIMLTVDDGYQSSYDFLFPLLKKMNMKATIFVIGHSIGADTYKNTGIKINRHFSAEEAREMVASGIIQIGSHSFDMHQAQELEDNPETLQKSMLNNGRLSENDYIQLVKNDLQKFSEIYKAISPDTVEILSYPLGEYDQFLTALLHESGIKGTFTSDTGINTLIKGLPQTLLNLKRINISENTDFSEFTDFDAK